MALLGPFPCFTLLSSFWYCGIFFSIWDRSLMVVCEGRGQGHPGGPGARTLPKPPPLLGFGGTRVHPVPGGPWCPSKGTFPIPSAPGVGSVPHGSPLPIRDPL